MENVRICFKDANPRDPLAMYPTVSIRAEIAGTEYGYSAELDYEPTAAEVCNAIQFLIDLLLEAEERINHGDEQRSGDKERKDEEI